MSSNERIDGFLARVQRRINLRALAAAAVWSLAAVSAALLLVATAYIAQGYAVDRRWYVAAAVAAVAATGLAWLVRLAGSEAAARFADRHFGLNDGLVSNLHFRRDGKTEGFYALQEGQTAARVDGLDPSSIDWRPASRPAAAATGLAAVALGLALIGPSPAVQEQLRLEDLTLTSTERANAELEELVRELNEQTSDALEREMINPDKLREMVEALEQTKDQKEALRQYAKLEQELNKQRARLDQKKDEHLMAEVAKELEKARETKPLGEQLNAKKYAKAAAELQEMKPAPAKQLSEQQKQLAKLRSASKRMAAAVRNQRGRNASGSPSKSAKAGQSAQAASSAASGKSGSADGAGGQGGGELGQAIQDLDAALAEWDGKLQEADRRQKIDREIDPRDLKACENCRRAAEGELDRLAKHLKRMQLKKDADAKLNRLCKACSECQGGMCQKPGANPGGKRPGVGTSLAQRSERDELQDNGQTDSLKGVKGEGPSQTSVETADEGTGTAARVATARDRQFRKQYESFVTREDVPDEVRAGVKQYFEAIHQIEE